MAGDSPLPSASCPGSPGPRPAALLGGTLISAPGVSFSGRVTPFDQVQDSFQINYYYYYFISNVTYTSFTKKQTNPKCREAPSPACVSAPSRLLLPRDFVFLWKRGRTAPSHIPPPPQLHDVFGQRSTSVPSRRLFRNASSEATLSEEEVCHDSLIVAGSVKGEGRSPHLREPGVCRLHTSADGTLTPPVRPGQWWEARTSRVARACLPGAPRACQTPLPGHAADSPGAAELCLAGRGPSGDTSS